MPKFLPAANRMQEKITQRRSRKMRAMKAGSSRRVKKIRGRKLMAVILARPETTAAKNRPRNVAVHIISRLEFGFSILWAERGMALTFQEKQKLLNADDADNTDSHEFLL